VDSMIHTQNGSNGKPAILHCCKREILRPLRDQILRLSGYKVDSADDIEAALSAFRSQDYNLVLIDVDSEPAVHEAERLCSEVKTERPQQRVAFVCNWRVAILSDCPDEIVRTEFNPEAFLKGVSEILSAN
jgi:DNA-binding response OmpR family regulator